MREILFRGREDSGEWVKGIYIPECSVIVSYFEVCILDTESDLMNCKGVIREVQEETVGQFTGVCDSAGEKIFEGDIVKAGRFSSYIVSFSEDRRGYYPFACGDGCGCCEYDTFSPSFCKVIGNIFDNPRLAEKATSE